MRKGGCSFLFSLKHDAEARRPIASRGVLKP
jgi:hypothetical protein